MRLPTRGRSRRSPSGPREYRNAARSQSGAKAGTTESYQTTVDQTTLDRRREVDDRDLIERITKLVAQEQALQESPDHDPAQLREVEVTLDQLWDLLRQRRSQEECGRDPDVAQPRDPKTGEGYIQQGI